MGDVVRKVQRKPTIFSRDLYQHYDSDDHYSNASLTVTWAACGALLFVRLHSAFSPLPPSISLSLVTTSHLPPLECKYWKTLTTPAEPENTQE